MTPPTQTSLRVPTTSRSSSSLPRCRASGKRSPTPADQATYFGGKTEIGEQGERWIRHATDKWPALTGVVLVRTPRRLLLTWGMDGNPPPIASSSSLTPPATARPASPSTSITLAIGAMTTATRRPKAGPRSLRPQDACRDRKAPPPPFSDRCHERFEICLRHLHRTTPENSGVR